MLEVKPPVRQARKETVAKAVKEIGAALEEINGVDFIDIPEIIEENYEGRPLYRNMATSEFGALLSEITNANIVINKVTAHFFSEKKFEAWLGEKIEQQGLRNFIFVGGTYKEIDYPGPSVVRANQIASNFKEIKFGNICIPRRTGEAESLASKTESGASFFATQLLFEPRTIEKVLEEYALLCRERNIKPAAFFLSFAPVAKKHDITFFKWLGADMPKEIEARIKNAGGLAEESTRIATDIFSEIIGFAKERGLGLDICPNIEAISSSNLKHACSMAIKMRGSGRH